MMSTLWVLARILLQHISRNEVPASALIKKVEAQVANPNNTGKRSSHIRSSVVSSAAASASWMALLAATSLGAVSVERMRAEVSAQDLAAPTSAGYRLIVQSYASNSVAANQLPGVNHRPLASAQRAVTAEELAHGVAVDVLQIDENSSEHAPVIVAWLEHGAPDLELDALRARPSREAVYGVSQSSAGSAQIVLRRLAA
ncbi:MAG TPA: hypothetical protein VER12_06250 [Polyangiaceae bacterium]|nr:hypothetical protein [Polyangiaceae bacterium]